MKILIVEDELIIAEDIKHAVEFKNITLQELLLFTKKPSWPGPLHF